MASTTRTAFTGAALACVLSLGFALPAMAQDYDGANWSAPRGYDMAYPENGHPNMVARQGYAAGFNEGVIKMDSREMVPRRHRRPTRGAPAGMRTAFDFVRFGSKKTSI